MNGRQYLIGFAVLAMTVGSASMANEIYKWTDAEGNVHYEDRPTGSANEERMALSYRRTDVAALEKRILSRVESQAARQEARTVAADEAKSAEAAAAEAAEKQKKGESYRAPLQPFVQSRRLYRQADNGERVYLDEQETQEARRRVEELIAENCSS